MSVCSAGARKVARRLGVQAGSQVAEISAFLCPVLLRGGNTRTTTSRARTWREIRPVSRRFITTESKDTARTRQEVPDEIATKLPRQCPGCGAHTQFVDKQEAGYYTVTRTSLQSFLGISPGSKEDALVSAALKNAGSKAEGAGFKKQKRMLLYERVTT